MWPAIIGAGAALIGGAMSDRSNRKVAESTNDRSEAIAAQNNALQREFAQSGIRWRVEDAKAAGLHPLFALGANTPTFSPSAVSLISPDQSGLGRGLAEAGQHVSRSIQAQQTVAQRQAEGLQLQLLHAQVAKEHALASYYDSEAARARQGALQSSPMPEGDVTLGKLTKTVPDEVVASRPGYPEQTAGTHPALMEVNLPGGQKMLVLRSDEGMGESMENTPLWMWPLLMQENERRYGRAWTNNFIQRYIVEPGKQEFLRMFKNDKRDVMRVLNFFKPRGIPHVNK